MHSVNKYTKNITLDLTQTSRSYAFVAKLLAETMLNGQGVLFFTKSEISRTLITSINNVNTHYIFPKWINGILSNFKFIRQVITKFKSEKLNKDKYLTKKEMATNARTIALKSKRYSGVVNLVKPPKYVVLSSYSASVVKEANDNNIPCII